MRGQESKMGEVVPSVGGDPAVFRLGGLGSDEACGVGDTEGANGPDVNEEGLVDR